MAADQVECDFVERSSAGGGAKINLAARVFSVPGDSRREVEQLGYGFEVREGFGLRRNDFGDAGKGSAAGLPHFGGERGGFRGGGDFEGEGGVFVRQEVSVFGEGG